jgi:hypothetical protein
MWERVDTLSAEIRKLRCFTADRGNLGSIVHTLSSMKGALHWWSKLHFGAVTEELNKLCRELELAKARNPASRTEIWNIADCMDELLYHEELMWLQCSRISWLKEGDRNTWFFHMRAKWRSRKNKMKKLKRGDGSWCDTLNEMRCMAQDYFVDSLTVDPEVCPSQVLSHVEPKVTELMNEGLCREFSEKEISDAMFQMGLLKAPGPDGFSAQFYQRH